MTRTEDVAAALALATELVDEVLGEVSKSASDALTDALDEEDIDVSPGERAAYQAGVFAGFGGTVAALQRRGLLL